MGDYNPTNPSESDKRKYNLEYDAYFDRYFRKDRSDAPPPNFKGKEWRSADGLSWSYTRGAAITPEGHRIQRAQDLAYQQMFGDHSPDTEVIQGENKVHKALGKIFGKKK